MLLFSYTITPRLQYVVDFLNKELFETTVTITTDLHHFQTAVGPRINYSSEPFDAEVFSVRPVRLLFEKGIRPQDIHCFTSQGRTAFFASEGDLPFDLLAATFYVLSRYEEYLPHDKDEYGRYAHTNSLAFREGFLDQPLVNYWLLQFKQALLQRFPNLTFSKKNFKCILSYDIDIAWSYLHKGFVRTAGGFARSVIKGQWTEVKDRWNVLRGLQKDPYDCFEWLDALHLYCRLRPYYFFLVARKQVGYDKNTPTDVKAFRQLIEYYSNTYKTGIHPSWQSGDDPDLLVEEKEWLEVVADTPITRSRQHYIRFELPDTYRLLVKAGIEKDFSMGYGSINGFRASVCSSFVWYDLNLEQSTSLVLYPFCFMDANSYYEQKDTPQQAYAELVLYHEQIRKLNGMMISIWHNSILGTDRRFAGWREMFELFMRETVYWDAYSD
ncbi:polysaccharide deacetylase family protein [Paraflavitalea pollutisoli]|uniref:polysaccharide deacetylase family protein n=1 Tax=Paraflavitalea pollutisoli TaxID=3034143 RepID=UPI0023EB85A6|nr:polysaccharide deacetylase family protein [Paraflavitalea sp. H1-2-19X]